MKKTIIFIGIIFIVAAGYCLYSRSIENGIIAQSDSDSRMTNLLLLNDCMTCHAIDAKAPFYSSFPVIGDLVKKDMQVGLLSINLKNTVDRIAAKESALEVDLSKLDNAISNETMPPAQYKAIHWNSSVSSKEKEAMLDWVRSNRMANYASNKIAKELLNEPIYPIETIAKINSEKAALGYKLFHDTRLSSDNSISCASCHGLATGGVDGLRYSKGVNNQYGGVNAPTVFNAVHNVLQFWDGRAKDLQEQAGGPPLNPVEMASTSWEEIIAKLDPDKVLKEEFLKVYPEGFSGYAITDAIAEFEKELITPDCRFDLYLKGKTDAITAEEKEGYDLFKANKCATCHTGKNIGGQSFEYLGLKKNYFTDRGDVKQDDMGRMNFTKDELDKHRFKTPTLRNVALTAPYLHDGTAKTMKEAVDVMVKYQVGTKPSDAEIDKIVLFMETLTGKMPDLSKYEGGKAKI